MIEFKRIRWINFLATGNAFTEIELDDCANTIVVGENGSGKSTLLDALCYVLFNKPFRKINLPQLVNSVNGKGCVVEIEFDANGASYKVRRGMKPGLFEIYKNGEMLPKPGKTTEYQDQLETHILGMDYKSCTQVVILGSSTFVPFMQLPAADRRQVIENLLDINIFSTMNKLLKEKIDANKQELQTAENNVNLTEDKIDLQKQHIERAKADNEAQIERNQATIESYNQAMEELNAEIERKQNQAQELQEKIADATKVDKRVKEYDKLDSQVQSKLNKLDETIKFFSDNSTCPTCKQDIDESFRQEKVSEKKSKYNETQEGREKLQAELKRLQDRQNEIANIQATINDVQRDISNSQTKVSSHQSYIQDLNNQIEELRQSYTDQTEDFRRLQDLKDAYNEAEAEKERLTNQKAVYTVAAKLLKDNGVKTQIIRQYVPIMNKLINKYLGDFDFFVDFNLDENFNETIRSRFRDDFTYASFSEGEKMRIDLALLLCWRTVAKMKNSVNTNLLILDEVFDASLDAKGCDDFLNVIHSVGGTNVFVISHRADLNEKFDRVIEFEKHKNYSVRVQ